MTIEGITPTTAREELTTGAAATIMNPNIYESLITTGGTAGSEDLNIGDGTDITVGQRKLVTLAVRTNASDVLNLDHANIHDAAGVAMTNCDLDAVDEFILMEWNGVEWQELYSDATITT